jgi:hypothetical protein
MRHDALMDHRWVELARTLRSLGMWEHLPEDEATAAERMVAEGNYPFVSLGEEPGVRYFLVDGETMAEGGVDRELRAMAAGLQTCGIDLQIETVNRPSRVEDGDYVVAINGRRCVVWSRRTGLRNGRGRCRLSGRWPWSTTCWRRPGQQSASSR